MAVAAVRQIESFESTEYIERPNLRLVEAAPEMAEDELIRQRAARFIGACALKDQIQPPVIESNNSQPVESLYDAIQRAAKGDKEARNMVSINARTDVIERTIKTGHVSKVTLEVDENGILQQFGQSVESIQENSLRFAADNWQMRERTEAEATNAFRIEQHLRSGKLRDHSLVVFSRAADNMTKAEMTEAGFFTDTMSCAIQVTTMEADVLTTESAFVSGVKQPGMTRHDSETVAAVGERLGVDLHNKSALETISTPLLVHNSMLPNGVIDLVELYDDCAGDTFFGEDRPREDYIQYKQKCEERELQLQPKVDAIVAELLGDALSIKTPLQAVTRLNKLSEKHMVEQAAFDDEINPKVFGPVAAQHIELARLHIANGDLNRGLDSIQNAKSTSVSSSCPSSLKKSLSASGPTGAAGNNSENGPEDDSGECDFVSKECPKCGTKNVKTHVTKTHISGSCGCTVKKP